MVDNINSNPSHSAQPSQVIAPVQNRPQSLSAATSHTQSPPMSVKEPEVVITEVAKKVASGKQDSLDSLEQAATELREAISTLNSALEKSPTKAIITRDEDLNRFIVRIADQTSGEVVREIPSEALLKFARNLQELKGLIFDASL